VISISSAYNIKKTINLTGITRTGCNGSTFMAHATAATRALVLPVVVCVQLVIPFGVVVTDTQGISG
jgi:hypothetical protein